MAQALRPTEPSEWPSSPDPATRLIGPIGPDRLDQILPVAIPLLAPALARDGWKVGVGHLRGLFESGGMQLWICLDTQAHQVIAALATEVLEYPQARVLSLAFCGGEQMERWAGWIEALEDVAKTGGCSAVRIPGRKGWERVFPGYEERLRVFEKQLQRGAP